MTASYGHMQDVRQAGTAGMAKVALPPKFFGRIIEGLHMPQNTKDSQGGKSHPTTKTADRGQTTDKAQDKKSSQNSPTGPQKHGEKKTTP